MDIKILSHIDLTYGFVETPKGFEIDRETIKNSILHHFADSNTLSKNPMDFSYNDFKVGESKPLQWFQNYIRDHFNAERNKVLIPASTWGNVLRPGEQSFSRNTVEPLDLKHSPDYTLLYCLDTPKGVCDAVIHYDDNRRANRTWHFPLENNKYIIFPSTQRYFITKNKSKKLVTFLTCTYDFVE